MINNYIIFKYKSKMLCAFFLSFLDNHYILARGASTLYEALDKLF